ncbi:MAG TPA: aminopeptidase P family N-terminal domain-containing protein, partial [Gaiellales bacterium]|nr:aminopeptidase P family N-terminal domain-containing protein [Gaiellales bacterium]
MATITRDGVQLDLPFTETEYRDRARRVREEMARRDVDVLLVLSPANLYYLTGFESIWYPPRAPVGAIVAREDERLLFVDYDRHRTLVERV